MAMTTDGLTGLDTYSVIQRDSVHSTVYAIVRCASVCLSV